MMECDFYLPYAEHAANAARRGTHVSSAYCHRTPIDDFGRCALHPHQEGETVTWDDQGGSPPCPPEMVWIMVSGSYRSCHPNVGRGGFITLRLIRKWNE